MTPSSPSTFLDSLIDSDQPFALIHREGDRHLLAASGQILTCENLTDIPRVGSAPSDDIGIDTISAIPFSQIRERGYMAHRGDARIQCLRVQQAARYSLQQAIATLPKEHIHLKDGLHFAVDDDQYATMVHSIIRDEIGNGEGANFVVPRRAEGVIEAFDRRKALSIFRSLLEKEFGAYMTFAFSDGERYLIGASPERHLTAENGTVRMNPISGTYRKTRSKISEAGILEFLRDHKEIHELFMVLDEELKMMAQMCADGGEVRGPLLREMSRLIHTEYELIGTSDQDVMDLFRRSMYAPTVTGSPVENACRVICKYDPQDRRYYSSALMLLGRDAEGRDMLDSTILIRMMEIHSDGAVNMAAGSTLVRDSDPMSEAKEGTAKLSALAGSLGSCSSDAATPELPALRKALDPILSERNAKLSRFFFENQTGNDLTLETLRGKRITIVMSDDDFAHTLRHMIRRMGADVKVVHCQSYDATRDDADLVILGPGTGDPDNMDDPKMRSLAAIAIDLEHGDRPFMAVCLGHQLLSKLIGLELQRKEDPAQGVPKEIDFFGNPQRVGFYNTFTAKNAAVPGVEVCADPATGEVHALRSKKFSSFQFHPESVLTQNGFNLLSNELVRLLRGVDPHAVVEALQAVGSIDLKRAEQRLGKTHQDYSPERIAEAVEEYRRYLVLMKLFPETALIPPTEESDEVWHNHLLHSVDYADDCEHLFGEFLHHQPGEGAMPPELYRETLELYRSVFGRDPCGTQFTE